MRKHPIRWTLLVLLSALVVGIVVFVAITQSQLDHLTEQPLEELHLESVEDGTYEGSYTVLPVIVKVEVTVEDHVITDITILEHINGQGKPAEAIVEDVIEAQSIKVDMISGSTYSSQVILRAIEKALR